mmetsp:Transcript_38403/g.98829  ORF Transcript_38403/g.98829 Transcript_38403/m.98829 type:complete len:136 (-) Transcript_38403:104-511(-)
MDLNALPPLPPSLDTLMSAHDSATTKDAEDGGATVFNVACQAVSHFLAKVLLLYLWLDTPPLFSQPLLQLDTKDWRECPLQKRPLRVRSKKYNGRDIFCSTAAFPLPAAVRIRQTVTVFRIDFLTENCGLSCKCW